MRAHQRCVVTCLCPVVLCLFVPAGLSAALQCTPNSSNNKKGVWGKVKATVTAPVSALVSLEVDSGCVWGGAAGSQTHNTHCRDTQLIPLHCTPSHPDTLASQDHLLFPDEAIAFAG